MKKNHFSKAQMVSILCLMIVTALSCTRHKDDAIDINLPAFQITESEKLVIPDAIKLPDNPPNDNSRVFTFFADGVQKYKAQEIAGSNPVAFEWQFVAPQADLYDVTNKKVGTHSQGPTWQLSIADSMFGQSFNPPRTAPGSGANSIDWLLLMPKTGKPPIGLFADVDYVQRVDTKGGKAPTTPPSNANETADVHYTAIYRFSKRNQ